MLKQIDAAAHHGVASNQFRERGTGMRNQAWDRWRDGLLKLSDYTSDVAQIIHI